MCDIQRDTSSATTATLRYTPAVTEAGIDSSIVSSVPELLLRDSRYAKQVLPAATVSVGDEGDTLEISAHECRKAFLSELENLLPGIDLTTNPHPMLVLPTMQHAHKDLVGMGEQIEQEKDRCLETFMRFAQNLCARLVDMGYFADYVDPCSGLVMLTPNANKVFSEVDSAQQLLGYDVQNCGCCKVLLHPKWGSAVYPASIFTNAPICEVKALL
jgi:hypothetical protein